MTPATELLDKVKDLKTKSDSMALKKTKGTVTGSMIGMAGGLLYGYSKGYHLLSSAFIGAVLGGIASYLLLPKIED